MPLATRDTFYEEQIRSLERLEKEMVLRIASFGDQAELNGETVGRLRGLLQHYRDVVNS
jgi:hypothetical protein